MVRRGCSVEDEEVEDELIYRDRRIVDILAA